MEENENILENAELLINSANGVYIPQIFAERYPSYLTGEQIDDLSNPDNEHYWETWETVLDNIKITIDGKRFTLHQDDDLWAIPESTE
jgi:hypothetical protein